MELVILVIHLILALVIIGLVLIQRSEGGGLGISGSGGGLGGLSTAKGTADALTRTTAICAGLFFCTSIALGILAGAHSQSKQDLLNAISAEAPAAAVQRDNNTAEAGEGANPARPEPEAPVAEDTDITSDELPAAPISE